MKPGWENELTSLVFSFAPEVAWMALEQNKRPENTSKAKKPLRD